MAADPKKCMICGKARPLKGGICDECQERIRGEALGRKEGERHDAERELRKQGVTPEPPRKKD
ncbi:MAG TPA: hypothetical protein VGH50_07615 [Candidatus Binatia bacterium]|jgi:hypothetical protein